MKTVGIVGGIGPESTIDYYRLFLAGVRERGGAAPPLLINSLDLARLVALIEAGRTQELAEHLLSAVESLARAGAELGLFAANTPHMVFDDVQRRSPIPLVSIVEATCEATRALGLKRVGLVGTRFTMRGRFYPRVFETHGIDLFVPEPAEQEYLHDKYMGELVQGVFLEETRGRFLEIVERLRERRGIEGVILGGTELPLLLRDSGDGTLPFLDTARIHVDAAIAAATS